MARRDAGEYELAPPTWMTLRRLVASADVDHALGEARGREPERFATRVSVADGVVTCLWAGDAGYPSSDASVPGPRHRLVMARDGWSYDKG
jgi:hypothetical protein